MPTILPIKELKNTANISQMCAESSEPIYITKNGYGDMVIMSVVTYEKKMRMNKVYRELGIADMQVAEGKVVDAEDSLAKLGRKYGL
mgnify:FL=1